MIVSSNCISRKIFSYWLFRTELSKCSQISIMYWGSSNCNLVANKRTSFQNIAFHPFYELKLCYFYNCRVVVWYNDVIHLFDSSEQNTFNIHNWFIYRLKYTVFGLRCIVCEGNGPGLILSYNTCFAFHKDNIFLIWLKKVMKILKKLL